MATIKKRRIDELIEQADAKEAGKEAGAAETKENATAPKAEEAKATTKAVKAEAPAKESKAEKQAKLKKGEQAPDEQMIYVNIDDIEVDPAYNKRDTNTKDYQAHLKYITSLIENDGKIKVPLTGYLNPATGKYILKAGHTRLAAAKTLEAKGKVLRIPFIPDTQEETHVQRLFDLISSNAGKELTMIEKAAVAQELLDAGVHVKDVAKGFGETQANINHLQKLHIATPQTKAWINEGRIFASSVIDMIRELGDPEAAEKEIEKMLAKQDKISKKDVKNRNAGAEEGDGEGEEDGDGEGAGTDGNPEPKSISIKKMGSALDMVLEDENCVKEKAETLKFFLQYARGKKTDQQLINFFKKPF